MAYRFCPRCAAPLPTSRDDAAPLRCTAPGCGFVYWNNPLPVVVALVEYRGAYVLARNAKWPRRLFSLISGFVDAGESPEQAVLRELREELNLHGTITRFIGHYAFPERNQLLIAYALRGEGELQPNDEIADLKLLSLEQLRAYDFTPLYLTTAIVDDWLAGEAEAPRLG